MLFTRVFLKQEKSKWVPSSIYTLIMAAMDRNGENLTMY